MAGAAENEFAKPAEGATGFVAEAEAHRRGGRGAEAEQVLREGLVHDPDCATARAVLSLVLLDQGRVTEARVELEHMARPAAERAGGAAFIADLTERELDQAFEDAKPDPEEVVDADRIAQQALRETDGLADDLVARPDAPFATRTMAELLAQQGDAEGASRVRAAIDAHPDAAIDAHPDAAIDAHPDAAIDAHRDPTAAAPQFAAIETGSREQVVAALEGWLENLRRERT